MEGERIAVIGAGAAGMMAAYRAASLGGNVTVFEKNSMAGKKIRITGKGRCNITNACSNEEFIRNIPTNSRFMYSSLNGFSPWDTIEFFESQGLKTKIERGNRVFPVSDKASDVAVTLQKAASKAGAVFSGHKVESIEAENGVVTGIVLDSGEKREFQRVYYSHRRKKLSSYRVYRRWIQVRRKLGSQHSSLKAIPCAFGKLRQLLP